MERPEKKEKGDNLNVVIIPSIVVQEKAIDLSKRIAASFDTRFVLEGKNFIPHITLYLTEYPKDSYQKIADVIYSEIENMHGFNLRLKSYSILSGFVFWDVVKNSHLQSIHENLLYKLSPLRKQDQDFIDLPGISEGQIRGLKDFGYALALEEYSPHITITRLKDLSDAKKAMDILPEISFDFEIDNITLSRVGLDGTCIGIIERFSL